MPSIPTIFNLVHTLTTGGVERLVATISAAHQAQGRFRPVVCAWRRGGPTKDLLDRAGVRTYVPNLPRHKAWTGPVVLYDLWRIYTTLLRLARDEHADMIYAHLPDSMVLGALLKKRLGVPLAVALPSNRILAEDLREGSLRHRAWRAAVRWAMKHADLGVAVSEMVRDNAVTQVGLAREKIVVVPNGVFMPPPVEEPQRVRVRAALGLGPEHKVLICVGRLVENKGQQFLVEMMPRLLERRPQVRLVLVGEGPNEPALREQVGRLGLQASVIFAGRRDDVPVLVGSSDIFMTASIFEGISFALLEALAAGLPAIATANDGNSEVLEGDVGLLLPDHEPQTLADAVLRLLDDPAMARHFAKVGLERVRERYSMENSIRQLDEHFTRLLASRPTRRG